MWRESARLWEASLGIIGMLGLMIGFGIAASFALNNAKRKQDGESARLAPKPSLAEEMEPILTKHFKTIGVVDCAAELAALVERRTK